MRRKIAVFTGTRAEYGLLFPVIRALCQSSGFELSLIVSGSHLDSQYGNTVYEIERDGFPIAYRVPLTTRSSNMAVGCGAVTQDLGSLWHSSTERPDALLVLGDRYETLGAAMAALLSSVPLFHMHGGDIVGAGMLDDPIRHAITKLAHLHFPATVASAERILKMGEEPWRVVVAGSPALDNLKLISEKPKSFFVENYGLNPDKPWVLMTMHPLTTTGLDDAGEAARQVLSAIAKLGERVEIIATYPNHDLGSQSIIEQLQIFSALPSFYVVPSLGRENYLNILRYVTLVIGNSSSGLLETAHFKVPCINVGDRQHGRERGKNVVDVRQDEAVILDTLTRILENQGFRHQLQQGSHPFGEGRCAETILKTLETLRWDSTLSQKKMTY